MTKPGGRMPPGGERHEASLRCGVVRSRVVATKRREGAVTRNEERRPHRSARAETGRRELSRRVAMDGVLSAQ